MSSRPKGEHGWCKRCGKELGSGTKSPCFYYQIREGGLIIWQMVCKDCR